MIRRLSLLELVLDLAFEDEKDRLGTACFDLAAPFEGSFLSCFVGSSSGIGRGGSPFSIQRTHEHSQTTRHDDETFPSFVLRLSFREMFPSFQHDHLWFLVRIVLVSTSRIVTWALWDGWANGNGRSA